MKLELYMFDTCPYCRRVLNYIAESGRTDVELHTTRTQRTAGGSSKWAAMSRSRACSSTASPCMRASTSSTG